MSKLRTVIKLHVQGKSKLFISSYLHLSRNTVKKYIRQFVSLKLTFKELDALDDIRLDELFFKTAEEELTPRLKALYSFFPYAEKELKKTGVTRQLLWSEYKLQSGWARKIPVL